MAALLFGWDIGEVLGAIITIVVLIFYGVNALVEKARNSPRLPPSNQSSQGSSWNQEQERWKSDREEYGSDEYEDEEYQEEPVQAGRAPQGATVEQQVENFLRQVQGQFADHDRIVKQQRRQWDDQDSMEEESHHESIESHHLHSSLENRQIENTLNERQRRLAERREAQEQVEMPNDLTKKDTRRLVPSQQEPQLPPEAESFLSMLRDPRQISNAIILQEILKRPDF
ncbi:Hypothetical protein PBC10988_7040 [Planctomycetales bacterium 10988]|nr:Hypothetical protein PBC10988_7040 [Planctomycetales bacterium 10988]